MTRKYIGILGFLLIYSMEVFCQENMNLNYLYSQWILPPEIVESDYLELRPYRIGFKKREKDQVISFEKPKSNVIFHYSSSSMVCPPFGSDGLGSQKWVVIPELNRLEHLFLDEKKEIIFSTTYEIVDVGRKILKLKRISEYFNEDWE